MSKNPVDVKRINQALMFTRDFFNDACFRHNMSLGDAPLKALKLCVEQSVAIFLGGLLTK